MNGASVERHNEGYDRKLFTQIEGSALSLVKRGFGTADTKPAMSSSCRRRLRGVRQHRAQWSKCSPGLVRSRTEGRGPTPMRDNRVPELSRTILDGVAMRNDRYRSGDAFSDLGGVDVNRDDVVSGEVTDLPNLYPIDWPDEFQSRSTGNIVAGSRCSAEIDPTSNPHGSGGGPVDCLPPRRVGGVGWEGMGSYGGDCRRCPGDSF